VNYLTDRTAGIAVMVNGWLLFDSTTPQKCVGMNNRKLLVAEALPQEGAYQGAPAAVTASGDRPEIAFGILGST
jgi:hypothetical protein